MTPSGIEPVTFRFVAQHLNHCATAVPDVCKYSTEFSYAVANMKSGVTTEINFYINDFKSMDTDI